MGAVWAGLGGGLELVICVFKESKFKKRFFFFFFFFLRGGGGGC